MITTLYDFINQCNRLKYTPDESHIDAFLSTINKEEYREDFIKFCFYNWENRMQVMDRLVELQNN